ncbi:hypothetical protein Trydic_g6575 [Trypoxylus dichotomus]
MTKLLEPRPTFLNKCSDYTTLKSIKSLNRETQYDFICLLYVNNYLSLCEIARNNSRIDNANIDIIAKNYNLTNTCQGLLESKLNQEFKHVEGILGYLKEPEVCSSLCEELLGNSVIPICNLAVVTLNITERLSVTHAKPQVLQESLNNDVSIAKPKVVENKVVIQDVIKDHKELKDKVTAETVEKPKLPKAPVQPQEVANSHPGNGAKSLMPNSNVQESQMAVDIVGKVDDTSIKANKKPPVPNAVEKSPQTQVQEPATKAPNIEPPVGKQESHEEEHQEKSSQASDDTNKKTPVEVQNDQKLSITTSTEAIPAVVQDAENDQVMGVNDERDQDQLGNEEDIDDDDDVLQQEVQKPVVKAKPQAKPQETDEDVLNPQFNSNSDEEDSFFFIYFMMVCAVFILGYIGYHNKQKVLALVIEGRRGRRGSRRGRPNSANYHKLDSNLEEAVTSSCNKNTTNIIY